MLKWPPRALGALVTLFKPLQDVEVFVEDRGDEVFYKELLQRAVGDRVRIARVFSLEGRHNVIKAAARSRSAADSRHALYLVDGDLEWVLGRPVSADPTSNLFRLNAYCIENLLVDESAAAKVLGEELVLSELDAAKLLAFSAWRQAITLPLVRLFAAFATLHAVDSTRPTVTIGLNAVLSEAQGTAALDAQKADRLCKTLLSEAAAVVGGERADSIFCEVNSRALALANPLDIVSGKDYLLPLLDFVLRSCKCRVHRKPLRYRLALHCDKGRFADLVEAIVAAAGRAR